MWLERILETPAGELFLFEARHWARRSGGRTWGTVLAGVLLLGVLAGVPGLFLVLGLAVGRDAFGGTHPAYGMALAGDGGFWAACSFAGFGTPLWLALWHTAGWERGGAACFARNVAVWSALLPILSCRLLLPAFAAAAVAPDRAAGRLHAVALLPLNAWRVLAAKGLAALFPFALITAVCFPLSLAGYVAALVLGAPGPAPGPNGVPGFGVLGILVAFLTPVRVVFDATILLCVSALCRQTRTAMALCYVGGLLVPWGAEWAVVLLWPGEIPGLGFTPAAAASAAFGIIAVQALALVVLLPRAFTALRYPEE